jgi:hypothetical protein
MTSLKQFHTEENSIIGTEGAYWFFGLAIVWFIALAVYNFVQYFCKKILLLR